MRVFTSWMAGPQSRALYYKRPLPGKFILLSLKWFRVRKLKPRCKHLQTEVYFFFLCTWSEHWKGKSILILSWQCLSLLPKAEIIISLAVTQLLREFTWFSCIITAQDFISVVAGMENAHSLFSLLPLLSYLQTWMSQALEHFNCTKTAKSVLIVSFKQPAC